MVKKMTKNKTLFTSRCARSSSRRTSSKQVGNLHFFTSSRRLQNSVFDVHPGTRWREVALLFLRIGAGRTEQSPGPVRGGCLTGHNRYKCSAGSLCFPGENQRRRTDSPLLLSSLSKSTPESRQSLLCRSDPRVSYGPGDGGGHRESRQSRGLV